MTQKYEFKKIKDVDLSKLEDNKFYVCETLMADEKQLYGQFIKEGITEDIIRILLPCEPINTDKLRDIFKEAFGKLSNKEKMISLFPTDLVFDFFLPHLSGSKEVEVSDEEIKKTAKMYADNYDEDQDIGFLYSLKMSFLAGSIWMRDNINLK